VNADAAAPALWFAAPPQSVQSSDAPGPDRLERRVSLVLVLRAARDVRAALRR
jgi:hypothetical protein